jgi:hypothetical protein
MAETKRNTPKGAPAQPVVRVEKIENGFLAHHQPGDYAAPTKTVFHKTDPIKASVRTKGGKK